MCILLQSFCSALNNELTEYYRLVAVLDAQVGCVAGGGMTLRRLLVWTHDPRERLQMLAILVDGCKRKNRKWEGEGEGEGEGHMGICFTDEATASR